MISVVGGDPGSVEKRKQGCSALFHEPASACRKLACELGVTRTVILFFRSLGVGRLCVAGKGKMGGLRSLHVEEYSLMRNLMQKLWADDAGIVSIEYLLVATIIGLGTIGGLAVLRLAITEEFAELANALQTLSQGFSYNGVSSCGGTVDGSQAIDSANSTQVALIAPTASNIQDINLDICP